MIYCIDIPNIGISANIVFSFIWGFLAATVFFIWLLHHEDKEYEKRKVLLDIEKRTEAYNQRVRERNDEARKYAVNAVKVSGKRLDSALENMMSYDMR